MNSQVIILSMGLAAVAALALVLFVKYRRIRERYLPVVLVDEEVAKLKRDLERLEKDKDRFLSDDVKRREELSAQYSAAKSLYERLRTEISLLEENVEDISFGLYKPHYKFETSPQYKIELDRIYDRKKEMARAGTAALCSMTWTVSNSRRDGERMTKQLMKVMLRAFNGEVDAAVAKVTWNNITRMEERIRKAHDAINSTGTVIGVTISNGYLELALAELRLTFEHEQKKHEEQEQQREIRQRMREEERAQREFEKAKEDAEADQARYARALEKARADVEKAKGEEIETINAKVEQLEAKLVEAQAQLQKATSMAQLTRSGNVYVISNVGSFGEDVFKIGMTRRLDPMERIHELGDAAVPFAFDVHAMIYSEDAPALEHAFHRRFSEKRVNLVNTRKEYFRIGLDEIEAFASAQGVKVEFTRLAEAREYRETLAAREQKEAAAGRAPAQAALPALDLPDDLFGEPPQRATGS